MPVVPFSTKQPSAQVPKQFSADEEPWALMAAAQMDAEGRLIEPFTGPGTLEEDTIRPVDPNEAAQSEAEQDRIRKNNNYPNLMNRATPRQKVPMS
jgi:hypothetical protein